MPTDDAQDAVMGGDHEVVALAQGDRRIVRAAEAHARPLTTASSTGCTSVGDCR